MYFKCSVLSRTKQVERIQSWLKPFGAWKALFKAVLVFIQNGALTVCFKGSLKGDNLYTSTCTPVHRLPVFQQTVEFVRSRQFSPQTAFPPFLFFYFFLLLYFFLFQPVKFLEAGLDICQNLSNSVA